MPSFVPNVKLETTAPVWLVPPLPESTAPLDRRSAPLPARSGRRPVVPPTRVAEP